MKIRGLAFFGAALTITALVGCSAEPSLPPPPSVEAMSPSEADGLAAEELAAYAQRLAGTFPGIELPEVTRERFIAPQEYGIVYAACMTEEGFDATPTEENTVAYGAIPDAQVQAQSVALYTCMGRYPTDPKYAQPMTDEQLTYLYAYSKTVLTPCLENLDVQVPAMPSEQAFMETFGSAEGWFAYENAMELPDQEFQAAVSSCPQFPENLWGS